ncbi:hypothetical protein [Phenylobacterium soli]|uniref:Uncharacterized protein n=1 Tax=Phenylobacterium soli TaxID=2170551 RepID=A0A328ALQ7_9CAUL|nr:hypothetical protein [Phenylobacterium soli]RAK53788.1 hypothetical protein DJ017_04220 [Phenylobacterium soli]
MEKIFVVKRVARKLWSTEAAIDGAMKEASELLAESLQAQRDVKLSPVSADAAQTKLMEAIKALSEARTAIVAAHGELDQIKDGLGIRTTLGGVQKLSVFLENTDEVRLQDVG